MPECTSSALRPEPEPEPGFSPDQDAREEQAEP
jgi:hypothetical protein